MKTKVGIMKRIAVAAVMLLSFTAFVFADGEAAEVFLTGTSNTSAGDFVVQTTNDLFQFQGREYEVFSVYYDNPEMNMKIAVNMEGPCRSFIAYNGEFMFFYHCNKDGFGVRKVMFSNPWVKDGFDAKQFQNQSILLKDRKIEKKDAIGLIAMYLPHMKG